MDDDVIGFALCPNEFYVLIQPTQLDLLDAVIDDDV